MGQGGTNDDSDTDFFASTFFASTRCIPVAQPELAADGCLRYGTGAGTARPLSSR